MVGYGVGPEPVPAGELRAATSGDVERLEASLRELLAAVLEMGRRQDTVDRRVQQIETMVTQLTLQVATLVAPPAPSSPEPARQRSRPRRTQAGGGRGAPRSPRTGSKSRAGK